MVAVIDIGNHNVHLGFYGNGQLKSYTVYPHRDRQSLSKIARAIQVKRVEGCAIASVVPDITKSITQKIRKHTGSRTIVISHQTVKMLRFAYREPRTIGADRIANVVGGLARYKQNVIIIDCGTAVTFDVALKTGDHLGGAIIPGMQVMIDALCSNAARVKPFVYRPPSRLIGTSTRACIRSGVHYGSFFAIEGLISALKKSIKKPCVCIATGGWGDIAVRHCDSISNYDRSLTLYGTLKIYQDHVKQ